MKQKFLLFFTSCFCVLLSFAQPYNDGPIEIKVKLREVNTIFDATDIGQSSTIASLATPDELSYILWARDDLGGVWTGGSCFTDDFTPAYNSGNGTNSVDFDSVFATLSYPNLVNPQFIDIKLDAWEDDNNSDAFTALNFVGITANTSGIRTLWDDYACQVSIWLPFIGTTCLYSDGDDYRCLADPFKSNLDYRLGSPCEWYNHGFIEGDLGACVNTSSDPSAPNTNGYYESHIETFWRYSNGTSFSNSINLGALPVSPASLQHFNSNECYNNYYLASTGNDVIYSFDIINPTGINISLCGINGAQFDSELYLVDTDTTTVIAMNNNSCGGLQSQITTSLCASGTYYVIVDATALNQFGTFTLEITEDPTNTFSVVDSISDYNGEHISCYGGADGKFYAHVNGGTSPYTYAWTGPNGFIATTYNDSLTGLSSGTYSVIVTDSKGCELPSLSVTLTDPSLITVTTVATATSCNSYSDGAITVTNTSGGVSTIPYTYSWNTTPISQTGTNATSLLAGSYMLTVTDANGCSITHQQIVTEPAAPVMSITSSNLSVNNNPLTFEVCDGNDITLTASSGLASYSWIPNIWLNTNSGPTVIASTQSNMTYTCTGTDLSGCTVEIPVVVNVVSSVNIYPSISNPQVCEGDSIMVSFSGASLYSWSPPLYLNTSTGSSVLISPQDSITYTITAENSSGCVDEFKYFIDFLTAPSINLAASSLAVCPNNFATLSATGASSYLWTPSISLNNNIGASVSATPTATTQYKVVGTDNSGCKDSSYISISVHPLPVLDVNGSSIICQGDTTTLVVSGALNYVWSPSSSLNTSNNNIVEAHPSSTQTYSISGTDINNCISDTIYTVNVLSLPIINITSSEDTICIEDAVILNASGANQYSWQPSLTLNNNTGSSVSAMPSSTTTYTLTATDINNCSNSENITIYVNPLPVINMSADTTIICQGDSINLNVSGAQDYLWSPALGLSTTIGDNIIASPNNTTNYIITATDTNGCEDFGSILINVNPEPIISLSPSSADICNGASITIDAFGGDSYSWSPSFGLNVLSGSSVIASPNSSVTYFVTGTDLNNCSSTSSFQLNVGVNPQISINTSMPAVICEGQSISLAADGASQYVWSPALSLSSNVGQIVNASPSLSTMYTVVGTDLLGCIDSASITISVNPKPTADLSINNDLIICNNDSAMILVEPTGNPPWNISFAVNGSLQSTINTSSTPIIYVSEIEGTYTVPFIEDANNCSNIGSDSVNVEVLNRPIASFDLFPLSADLLDPEITFSNNSIFANTWSWDFGDGFFDFINFNTSHDYYAAGIYQITLVVNNGICSDTVKKELTITPVYTIYIPEYFTPNNDGLNDVFLPKGQAIAEFEMFIFNRWGEQIFYSDDINYGWNGLVNNKGKVVVAKYTYTINITDELGVFHTLTGDITLH